MDKLTLNTRQAQAAERRKQLLNAAKELFAEKGYHATSMREITRKVGMSDGLTYHYFPKGKSEILHTILREGQEERMEAMNQIIQSFDNSISLREALIKLSHHIFDSSNEDRALTDILFKEKHLLSEDEANFFPNVVKKHRQIFINFLADRASRGEIIQMDFELASFQFVSNINMLSFRPVYGLKIFGEQIDAFIERYVNFTIDLWSPK